MLLMYFCSLIVRSKLIELRPEKDMVDYMKKKRKSGIDKKSLKLTGLAVDEDSSAILVKVSGVLFSSHHSPMHPSNILLWYVHPCSDPEGNGVRTPP